MAGESAVVLDRGPIPEPNVVKYFKESISRSTSQFDQ